MRSPISLLVPFLSFLSFAVAVPLHSGSPTSRLTKNHISARQFHYPRTPVNICAGINRSLIPEDVDLGTSLDGINTCLCVSTTSPLGSDLDTDLKSLANSYGEDNLKSLVQVIGTQCTYPLYAVSRCSSGNPCDFTCTDGFVKTRDACFCPPPNSVCNGKCGSHPNGCSSALPRAPKMKRTVIPSPIRRSANSGSSSSGGLNLGGLVSGLLGSEPDLTSLVNNITNSLGISVPITGDPQPSSLEADLSVCFGTDLSGTQSMLDTITSVTNPLLSSLLGTTVNSEVNLSCSTPVDPSTISMVLRVGGLSDLSLGSTLDNVLGAVAEHLNGLLGGVKIETTCSVDGSINSTTPASSSPTYSPPFPSNTVDILTSTSPAGTDLSGLLNESLDQLLSQVGGILDNLGLSSGNYSLDSSVDPIVWMSVGLSDSLSSVDGLVTNVMALIDEILDSLLASDVNVQLDPNSTSPLVSPGEGMVVGIDLGSVMDVTLSDKDDLLDAVPLAVSEVLASLLNIPVTTTADGGLGCGCGGPKKASAKR